MAAARRLAGRLARRLGLRRPSGTPDLERKLAKARSDRDATKARLAKVIAARDGHAERAERLATELEALRAQGDADRDRPDLAYLFVLTYGRSGSTLLQGILSATPGVVVRGENGGVLTHLFGFHDTITRHKARLERPQPLPPSHPWWGIDGYPDATALRDLRLLMLDAVLRPAPDTRVVGFKEIDWPAERLPEVLAFLRAVFPGARVVLNTRDLTHVAQSKWWARRPDAMGELQAMEARYVEAADSLGDDAYRVHYDEWVADPTVLRGLFEWLGEPFDEQRIRAVMDVRHSY